MSPKTSNPTIRSDAAQTRNGACLAAKGHFESNSYAFPNQYRHAARFAHRRALPLLMASAVAGLMQKDGAA
jgi:hypothetical protein